jgi:hypothetical protein
MVNKRFELSKIATETISVAPLRGLELMNHYSTGFRLWLHAFAIFDG